VRLHTAIAVKLALDARRQAERVSPEEQETLVKLAREWLDEGNDLDRANGNLERVLKANPVNAPARIEMARYYIMSGHINYRNFRPGTLENAANELQAAVSADPKSPDPHVLIGHVQYLAGNSQGALKSLEKAEFLGGESSPWLYLNWADALMDLNQLEAAEAKLTHAEALFTAKPPPKRVRSALYSKLSHLYTQLHKLDDADKQYRAQLELEPANANLHGNYSEFLLFERALPDAAIAEAENALRISNYGMARLSLAAARYAKWAELKTKSPQRAAELLVAAKADTPDFSWIMPQAASAIGTGPAIERMVKELVALGVPLDTKDEHGDTGLTLAAYSGKLRSVELLAKRGANLETRDSDGQTAFIIAARRGYVDVVKLLAARGARINAQDSIGRSALNWAVGSSDEAMVRALIAMKINVNLANTSGYTALMQTAFGGNASMAELLLAAGANLEAATITEKRTAADFAEAKGHGDLATLLRRATAAKK
jgi:ankyrin repeat protein/cytochrome c-type biogenesis protein CcmH/NrfG